MSLNSLSSKVSLLNLLFLSILSVSKATINDSVELYRSRRQLTFPNSTTLQFNFGVSTPSPMKMINLNYAIQTNFQLPWNRTQIPMDLLSANTGYDGISKKRRDVGTNELEEGYGGYESDARLYHFYKFVEEVLNSFGHNGTSCVLQTLCQLGAEPLHSDHEEDLLHEIASFILNPTNDVVAHITDRDESYPYIEAYTRGHKGQECAGLYETCTTSLLDMFTKLHDIP